MCRGDLVAGDQFENLRAAALGSVTTQSLWVSRSWMRMHAQNKKAEQECSWDRAQRVSETKLLIYGLLAL